MTSLIDQAKSENFGAKDKVHQPYKIDEETGEYAFKIQSVPAQVLRRER